MVWDRRFRFHHARQARQAHAREDVNAAIRKHLGQGSDGGHRDEGRGGLEETPRLRGVLSIKYDGEKPKELLDEDKVIGLLSIPADKVKITPVDEVFAK